MTEHPDPKHHVRRVVLPSGKTIEVVYFEDQAVRMPDELKRAVDHHEELHVCMLCESELVYPVEWSEAGTTHWQVTLRCPNCEWTDTGIFDQESVERFDEELDRGTEALVNDLRRLVQANMESEIEQFVRALEADAVLPEDFGSPSTQL
jgi:hypothetical protein